MALLHLPVVESLVQPGLPLLRAGALMSTLRAALNGHARLSDLVSLPVAGIVIVICYGCAGSRTEPDGRTPCRRCRGTGIDPNPN